MQTCRVHGLRVSATETTSYLARPRPLILVRACVADSGEGSHSRIPFKVSQGLGV